MADADDVIADLVLRDGNPREVTLHELVVRGVRAGRAAERGEAAS